MVGVTSKLGTWFNGILGSTGVCNHCLMNWPSLLIPVELPGDGSLFIVSTTSTSTRGIVHGTKASECIIDVELLLESVDCIRGINRKHKPSADLRAQLDSSRAMFVCAHDRCLGRFRAPKSLLLAQTWPSCMLQKRKCCVPHGYGENEG